MRIWVSLVRLMGIVAVCARHAAAYFLLPLLGRIPILKSLLPVPVPPPERLRMAFEDLGGTFIKFGQMLALQPDILSIEYCNALFNLLDRVPPFEFAEVERIFLDEFGRRPAEIFNLIDPEPLAAASIGQVHVAWLNGKKLAVKVQRPTVDKDFDRDIRLMAGAIRVIRLLRLRSLHWMIEPMSEFVAWTREELDYRTEARYIRRLRENSLHNRFEHVPELMPEFTTRRTLVMEFLEGTTVLGYLRAMELGDRRVIDRLASEEFDSYRAASHIIDNFLGDVFEHGMFHADLHPANLMILPGNVIGYIDFGITGTISSYSRRNLVALTLAYTQGDLKGMCQSFFRVSAMGPESDPSGFEEKLKAQAKSWYDRDSGTVTLKKNFTLVMLDMLTLSRATGIWPERDVIKYIRSAIAIDGLVTRFAPGFDLARHLESVCDRFMQTYVQRSLLNYRVAAEWSRAAGSLLSDGPGRAGEVVRQAVAGDLSARIDLTNTHSRSDALRRKAVRLGAGILVASAGIVASGADFRFGANPITAASALMVVALAMLARTIWTIEKG